MSLWSVAAALACTAAAKFFVSPCPVCTQAVLQVAELQRYCKFSVCKATELVRSCVHTTFLGVLMQLQAVQAYHQAKPTQCQDGMRLVPMQQLAPLACLGVPQMQADLVTQQHAAAAALGK